VRPRRRRNYQLAGSGANGCPARNPKSAIVIGVWRVAQKNQAIAHPELVWQLKIGILIDAAWLNGDPSPPRETRTRRALMKSTRFPFRCASAAVSCALFATLAQAAPLSILHSFAGGTADGSAPVASLMLAGNSLFGTTLFGGGSLAGKGTVFSLNTDGTSYQVLHKFTGSASDG
jgi:uncharacterized repeat protein (TIGR03803 family)